MTHPKRAFAALIVFLFFGSAPLFSAASVPSGFPVRVRDDTGTVVALAAPPRRIVSLAPNMTEILFAVGAGRRVVGVSDYCDYPLEAKRKIRVGSIQLKTETILALRPDLVIAHAGMQPGSVSELRRLGLNVLALLPEDWAGVIRTIRILGRAVGREEAARAVIRNMQERRSRVERLVRGRRRVRVFVEVWDKPLMTAGPGTFIHELIRTAGGENVAADAAVPWAVFPSELVLARDPEVIVLTCKNRREVVRRPGWEKVSAVRAGRVYEVDPDIYSRPGPRLADALENLAALLWKPEGGSR